MLVRATSEERVHCVLSVRVDEVAVYSCLSAASSVLHGIPACNPQSGESEPDSSRVISMGVSE